MDCIPKKGEIPRGIPADVWALVQAAPDIIVEQYRQKGGNLAVAKGATHLPDSGRKKDGINPMVPVTSFFVKSFRDRVLVLSGYSVSASARNGKVLPPPTPLLLLLGAAPLVVAPPFNPPSHWPALEGLLHMATLLGVSPSLCLNPY